MNWLIVLQSVFLIVSYVFHVPSCIAWSPIMLNFFNKILLSFNEAKSEIKRKEKVKILLNKVSENEDMGEAIDEIVKKMKK